MMTKRFTDEEIAIATCLLKMKEYTQNGTEFYNTDDAFLDNMLI